MTDSLRDDSLLRQVPVVQGFKLLEPVALYARLGEGGMAVVYRGRHVNLDIDVAVKCLKPEFLVQPLLVKRFEREARLAAEISSPNLVRVYDVREKHGLHYIVMEHVLGETLRGRVTRKGRLAPAEAAAVVMLAARGLAVAHSRGVVHRDIKPDNILVARDGSVKVTDLGLAKSPEGSDLSLTSSQAMMGTPHYMPPEQFQGAKEVGPEGDVYALGATLHFLLAGDNPVRGSSVPELMMKICFEPFPTLDEIRDDVSAELASFILRCTSKKPEERPVDAGEFAHALEKILPSLGPTPALDDAKAGEVSEKSLVSPPPSDVIAALKKAQGHLTPKTEFEARGAILEDDETKGRSTGIPPTFAATQNAPRVRRMKRVAAAATIFAIAAYGSHALGIVDLRPPWVRAADRDAAVVKMRGLIQDAHYAEAIPIGRKVYDEAHDHPGIRTALATALARESEGRLQSRDLGMAFDFGTEAALVDDGGVSDAALRRAREALAHELESAVILTSPVPGKTVTATPVTISGSIQYDFGPVATVTLGNKVLELDNGRFEATLTDLHDGPLDLKFELVDARGIRAEREFKSKLNAEPPAIEIDSPKEGALGASPLVLAGRAPDDGPIELELRCGGIESRGSLENGKFRFEVALPGGERTIELVARDEFGRETVLRRRIEIDDVAPRIEMRTPRAEQWLGGVTIPVEFVCSDAHGVAAATIGGRPAAVSKDGLVSGEVAITGNGAQKIHVTVRDEAGNESAIDVPVRIDRDAPKVVVTSPAEGDAVPQGPIVFTGTLDDASPRELTINGRKVPVDRGRFSMQVDVDELGVADILVRATDSAGNATDAVVRVNVCPRCATCASSDPGRCPSCNGTKHQLCAKCHGGIQTEVNCADCDGSGCAVCKGSRLVSFHCNQCGGGGTVACYGSGCVHGRVLVQRCYGHALGGGFEMAVGDIDDILKKIKNGAKLPKGNGGGVPVTLQPIEQCPWCTWETCTICNGTLRASCTQCHGSSQRPCSACTAVPPGGKKHLCDSCDGKGKYPGECPACKGGRIHLPDCQACHGTGLCRDCQGKGIDTGKR